jgi:putative Ig domain-containing protein
MRNLERVRVSSLLLLAALLAIATSAAASEYRYAKVRWCWSPTYPNYYPIYQSFTIEAAYRYEGQAVGDTVTETFYFGDGTSEPVVLTVVEVHAAAGWFLARGHPERHLYVYGGSDLRRAGLDSCCRIDGTGGGDDLNNRSNGDFAARVLVYPAGEEVCSPLVDLPPIVWLSGGLGDTFVIPIPARGDSEYPTQSCRLAREAEAGGGPNPEGLSVDSASCVLTWTPTTGDPAKLWTAQVQVESSFDPQIPYASTAVDFLLGLDAGRPVCQVQSVDPGPPTRLNVSVRDVRSGLASVQVLESDNATVNIPSFEHGTDEPLIVVATKIDQTRSSQVGLRVTDLAGNVTECDPVLTQEVRENGKPESSTYAGIPPEEHVVTVYNGDPGLRMLAIDVNGKKFKMTGLRPGEKRSLDVASAVTPGMDSIFTLTAHGEPGGGAAVMIWDGNGM